jgi:hypothetical protein
MYFVESEEVALGHEACVEDQAEHRNPLRLAPEVSASEEDIAGDFDADFEGAAEVVIREILGLVARTGSRGTYFSRLENSRASCLKS